MRSGRLRHRVRLERPANVQNPDTGAMEPGWALVRRTWADIEPLSARDFIAAQAGQSEVSARITLRWRDDITAEKRLVDERTGKVYNIAGVLPDPKSGVHYVTLPVKEGVNDGR
ncbi:phage head closure protein [Halomonas getboli]|uniref:phage head closure protein n=1 Tax=Halomonas getboli TaxID=2935862 RepID=UPI001FFFC092|nr:phage head closure protein [Halomonas getboli]MCK2183508.1 phage head closure protein [Halomonas getboli]